MARCQRKWRDGIRVSFLPSSHIVSYHHYTVSLPFASILPSAHLVLPRVFSIATETYAHTRYRIRQPLSPPYSPRQRVPFSSSSSACKAVPSTRAKQIWTMRRAHDRSAGLGCSHLAVTGRCVDTSVHQQDDVPDGGRGYVPPVFLQPRYVLLLRR
jgi:hypothetical protein